MMKRMTKNLRALSALGMRTTMMLTVVMMSMFASPYGVWAQSGQAVATVLSSGQENPVEYTDLEAAFAAAKNNDEMKLLADCALAADSENGLLGKLVLGNGTAEINVVLDLNGHTISGSADELITVTTNAYLTITDRSADGKGGIVTTGEKAILNVGILAVIGGSVSGKTCGIYSRGTSVNIGIGSTGCAGTISGSSYGLYIEQGVANISGGNFVATGTGGIGIECANSTGFYFLGLPTFNCTVADISLAKDQKIEFADGSYAAPTNKIKVKVANTAPYIFTMVYGRYVKNADGPFDPEAVFEYYDATAGLSFKLVDNGDYGTDVQIYQKDPLSGKRIAVIADPHVMPASLLTDANNTDWKTYLAGSRKLVDYSQTLFDQTVATLKSDKPELVLIVGDLTKDGEQASHNYLKGKLDELKAASIPTLVIPGNHDLGSSDAKIYGKTTTAAPAISQSDFAQLYQDYGYGSTSERESTTSLTYACEPITGLVVIGIDSGEEGQLSESTLTWVCNKAVAARSAGKQVIAMMHHPLIPHITGGEAFVSTVSVADYATVRNSLADAGISVIFTGHFHTSDIAKDWNGDKTLPIYDVSTGSLCSYPCDYRVVTLNDALTQMQIDTRSITTAGAPLGGGDNFTTAIAKSRLSGSMVNILTPKLTAKLLASGTPEPFATAAVSTIASNLARAYIYHAEGDEHKNSAAQSLLSDLNSLLANYPAYKTMANSMLEDKSNYGTDRADQTNDRSLIVSIMVSKNVQSLEVTVAQGPFIYTGQEIKPAVTVRDGETDVTACFDVAYTNNIDANDGTGNNAPTITVSAKTDYPQYSGKVTKTFAIMTTAKIEIKKPEQLKKGDTFDAAIGQTEAAPQEVSTNYTLCILEGVWVNATVTAELESLSEGKATYTVTGNKASKLSFRNVEWKDNGALMDHSKTLNNIDFSGAAVETSNINFTNIESLNANQKMTLVADFGDAVGTITGTKYIIGTTLEGAGEASLDGNNLIFTIETATAQAQTHNTVMAADISCATLSFGDCIVDPALDGLSLASNTGADGVATFAQTGGGSMRQETGARAMVRGGKVVRPYFNLCYSGARIMCKAADVALQAAEETQGKVRGVAEPDITIESGKTYEILTDEDLILTLKLSEGDILITAITLKYPDPNDLNLDGEVNVADIVKAIADGKSQPEIDAIVDSIME